MITILVCAIAFIGASILIGRAVMVLSGWHEPSWLAGAVGFALLVVISPFLDRLPGRGVTAFILIALLTLAAAIVTKRATPRRADGGEPAASGAGADAPNSGTFEPGTKSQGRSYWSRGGSAGARPQGAAARAPHLTAIAVIVITLAVASLPFLFNERTGVLGEGIYTNDHAAQLYWAQWLADGFGPEPNAVAFGYPVGPQALTAALSAGTTINLENAFNGLLLAIPVLTALAALALLGSLPPIRRTIAACLAGLPYLAASFLAQSSFKETAMAMFVLALAVALHQGLAAGRARSGPTEAHSNPAEIGDPANTGAEGDHAVAGPRALVPLATVVTILALAAVFTFSIPGAAWFVLAIGAVLAISYISGELRLDLGALRGWAGEHRKLSVGAGLLILALLAIAIGPGLNFISKIDDVQQSSGRLSSPVFPGEALGIWPQGDFRIVRGDVSGAVPAVAFAFVCAALAGIALIRHREWALLSVAAAALVVYGLARPFAEIHVEAKALCVLAPITMLITLRWLLGPADGKASALSRVRLAAGALFVVLAALSTLVALRAAPVSFDQRADALERLGDRIQGKRVIFLGLDRFAAYRLRGTLIESPGGYVPPDVKARPQKVWQQGTGIDFDTVKSRKLDDFDYAITTSAVYQSTAPPNWHAVGNDGDYVLWKRSGPTAHTQVLNEGGNPGKQLDCTTELGAKAKSDAIGATVLDFPESRDQADWSLASPFDAPASATVSFELPPGRWEFSMQYHGQVPLTVTVDGRSHELAPSLDGFYLSGAGRGAFWPAGSTQLGVGGGTVKVTVSAEKPSGLQDLLGVERKVWLGTIAASRTASREASPRTGAVSFEGGAGAYCGSYFDHYTIR